MENNKEPQDKQKKRRLIWLLLLLLMAFMIAGGLTLVYLNSQERITKKTKIIAGDFLPSEKDASKMNESQLARSAQSAVNKSKFQMIINPEINANQKTAYSDMYIENPANNAYPIAVTINLDSGMTIYSSGAIKPGYEVKNAKLDKVLKVGHYTGKANFKLYNAKTSKAQGQVSTAVKIVVQD
ncbi:hypothetical protein EFN63_05170 [Leuconostoc citreum]|uniref:Uncharacterized protein n=2 Tax=Leuconostoc citreum TaxID=33964 RepID=A0A5A5U726_LEUCI|nr:hypothetical protein [Leuconostoc citreum]MCS8595559.1 hypothetical protein [Leuconostoc citreum]MCT3067763.1 hypothetical protein [Leuconostoc citreum]OSP81930.1 hypothetical protein B9J75_04570 [Leuconostoc citreum]QEA45355.1 hypothetical protein FGL82_02620 [Leuconostoc citreum]QEA63737.1 hypothetical protein FGL72_08025 [Leuconostoc citreum]